MGTRPNFELSLQGRSPDSFVEPHFATLDACNQRELAVPVVTARSLAAVDVPSAASSIHNHHIAEAGTVSHLAEAPLLVSTNTTDSPGPFPQTAEEQQEEVAITLVQTAQELRDAIERGDRHIELREHLDLRQMQPMGQNSKVQGFLGKLPLTIRSIRVRFQIQAKRTPRQV
jgi:hypothetical protein